MVFLVKTLVALSVVFLFLPEQDSERVMNDVTRAVSQDRAVKTTVDRTNQATDHLIAEGRKLCIDKTECLDVAAKVFTGTSLRR
jgi:hypothetical protein